MSLGFAYAWAVLPEIEAAIASTDSPSARPHAGAPWASMAASDKIPTDTTVQPTSSACVASVGVMPPAEVGAKGLLQAVGLKGVSWGRTHLHYGVSCCPVAAAGYPKGRWWQEPWFCLCLGCSPCRNRSSYCPN